MEPPRSRSIRPDRSDKTLKYEVRKIADLVERILPHFREYPLLSAKQNDLERFDRICQIVSSGKHQEPDGLKKIVELAMQMNPSGKRKYVSSDILRSLGTGEGIVCATG